MQNNQLLCDHCGEVLYGKVGTAYVAKDYIQVRGRVAFEHYNKNTGRYDYVFITPSETEDLTFCLKEVKPGVKDFSCFENYAEHMIAVRTGNKSRTFGAQGEIKPAPEPEPEPAREETVAVRRPVGRPRKFESSLAPLERPKNMPPFKI
jgi:hypothetical protein